MSEKKIHIVSFDVPWPADYGGVIDVFHKIRALSQRGWKIHLHAFTYGRPQQEYLNQFCSEVTYYKRNISKAQLFRKQPYIVCSRSDEKLRENLLSNQYPILFEGLHTTAFTNDPGIVSRCIVRAHNVEHVYYRMLAKAERNPFKKYYFNTEASKLEAYERILNNVYAVASLSVSETHYFQSKYHNAFYLPAFHPFDKTEILAGKGDYAFYHGNLSVAENNQAALFLILKVFSGLKEKLIIAGNHPTALLKRISSSYSNIRLIENPGPSTMKHLIQNAQIHVLPAFQSTGVKLKLLASLFSGRHVMINNMMGEGSMLEDLCIIKNTAEEMKESIPGLMQIEYTNSDISKRSAVLSENYSNENNIRLLEEKLKFN